MVTHVPSQKHSLRLIQRFRCEQPVSRLSLSKSTLGWLSCSPEVLTKAKSTTSSCSVFLLVQYLQVHLPCNLWHTKVLFPPQIRGWLALTMEITRACTQNLSCTLFSAGSSSLLNMKQATQTFQSSKHKDGKSGNVKTVHVLKCSHRVTFPSPRKENNSLLFWPVFLIRGKYSNYSLPDYKWNYKSVLRAQYCTHLDVISPHISFNLDRYVVLRHHYRKLYK